MRVFDLSGYRTMKLFAEMYFDVQQTRIAMGNRVKSADVFPDIFAEPLRMQNAVEGHLESELEKLYREVAPPGVVAWQEATLGIGHLGVARLLGHIGHPRIATPAHWEGTGKKRKLVADEPFERRVSELWQYCGHGRPGRRQKGMTAEEAAALGNPMAKMVLRLVADSATKEPGRQISQLINGTSQPTRSTSAESLSPQPTSRPANPRGLSSAGDTSSRPTNLGATPKPLPSVGGASSQSASNLAKPKNRPPAGNTSPQSSIPVTKPRRGPTIGEPHPGHHRSAVWPYRRVYEARRVATIGRVHVEPCVQCGTKGKPAPVGSRWRRGHAHSDALRIVGKQFLRDLWLAAADDG